MEKSKTQVNTEFQDFLQVAQDFVYQAGAITLEQLQSLFPNFPCNELERIITSRLCKNKQCQYFGRYYCPKHDSSFAKISTERMLWVALDIMEYNPAYIPTFSRTHTNDYLIIKNDTLYELDYIHDNNLSAKITYLNEKYNSLHKKSQSALIHVLVAENENLLDKLDKYNIVFPYIVAVVSNERKNGKPEILTTEIQR